MKNFLLIVLTPAIVLGFPVTWKDCATAACIAALLAGSPANAIADTEAGIKYESGIVERPKLEIFNDQDNYPSKEDKEYFDYVAPYQFGSSDMRMSNRGRKFLQTPDPAASSDTSDPLSPPDFQSMNRGTQEFRDEFRKWAKKDPRATYNAYMEETSCCYNENTNCCSVNSVTANRCGETGNINVRGCCQSTSVHKCGNWYYTHDIDGCKTYCKCQC